MEIQNILVFLPPLLVAMILGAIIGVERNMAGRPAGMRTFALVSMGSALFIIISNSFSNLVGMSPVDSLHLSPQILVGIGFIGAGLVLFHDNKVTGLTSAAGMWVAAGIGMACGFGMYILAVIVTILTLTVFSGMWILEDKYLLKKVHYPEKSEDNK